MAAASQPASRLARTDCALVFRCAKRSLVMLFLFLSRTLLSLSGPASRPTTPYHHCHPLVTLRHVLTLVMSYVIFRHVFLLSVSLIFTSASCHWSSSFGRRRVSGFCFCFAPRLFLRSVNGCECDRMGSNSCGLAHTGAGMTFTATYIHTYMGRWMRIVLLEWDGTDGRSPGKRAVLAGQAGGWMPVLV
ncbi:uncharacterized protein J3D65DRAFT_156470 [Phyllosticta citribraziliensis]|uniref:Uncharacterized protein n=1 Tax=Phyllosticta citribraziliensis TaxID=989973 RepID=A0ABR1L7X9_9PEZI